MHNTHLPDIILFYRGITIQNEHSRRLFSIINDINLLTRLREAHTVLLKKCFQSRPPSPLPPPPRPLILLSLLLLIISTTSLGRVIYHQRIKIPLFEKNKESTIKKLHT